MAKTKTTQKKTTTTPATKKKRPRADEKWISVVWTEPLNIEDATTDREKRAAIIALRDVKNELHAFAKKNKRSIKGWKLIPDGAGRNLLVAMFVTRVPASGTLYREYRPKGPCGPRIKLTYRKVRVRVPKSSQE